MPGRLAARARRLARPLTCLAAVLTLAACGADARTPVEPPPPPVSPAAGPYTDAELRYFGEIAFGFEFGVASPVIRKWRTDVRVAVRGAPTADDQAVLAAVMQEATAAVGGPIQVRAAAAGEAPNVVVEFIPRAEFATVFADATRNGDGEFRLWWDATNHLVNGWVLIATDAVPRFRRHVLREELTQVLGLAQDSWRYPASIFYQGVSDVSAYASIDRVLVEMLYRPEVTAGMTADEAVAALRPLERRAR